MAHSPTPQYATASPPLAVVLSLLGRGVIAYHPSLVRVSGGVTPALMLSQALYWTRILAQREASRDGWFWKTRTQWTQETALSRNEQETARKRLAARPFWHQQRRGMPARLWFRVDLEALARAIDDAFNGTWDWQDQAQVLELLGRPLVVYRSLAAACGSVTAAILLSRLIHEVRSFERRHAMAGHSRYARPAGGWHTLCPGAVMTATGLSRAEFYHARRTLRQEAYVHDRLEGVPPRALWRLDTARLIDALQRVADGSIGAEIAPQTRVAGQLAGIETDSWQDSGQKNADLRTLVCAIPHSKILESRQLKILNPANLMAGNRTASWQDSGFPYTGLTTDREITSETPPPTPSSASREDGPDSSGRTVGVGSSIIWPKTGLLPAEQAFASALLDRIPEQAQMLVDELAGQMAKGIVREPLPYLRRLADQALCGRFVPLVATRVAAQRERVAQLAQARRGPEGGAPIQSVSELTPCQREARRASLRQARRALGRSSRMTSRTPDSTPSSDEMI